VLQEIGDRHGQADTWDSLGHAHYQLGDHLAATAYNQIAADLYRELGDFYQEADALNRLGDTHRASGADRSARVSWSSALAILTKLGHPDAARLRTKLRRLDQDG
jgi:tetratricopeptide (TPR) repeat protein